MDFKTFRRRLRIPYSRFLARRRLQRYHGRRHSLEETVGWAMNFGGDSYFKVQTLQVRSEILALAQAVAELSPRNILEIGTARGGTLLIWASLAARRVVSCDLQDFTLQGDLFRAFPPPGSSCQVVLLSGDSHDPSFRARVEQALAGEPVDLLFIDGDHSESGVEADYRDYSPLVRPGGLIAFHDVVESQPLPGNQVHRFWRRIRQGRDTREFIADAGQCGFGIGVIRVPDG